MSGRYLTDLADVLRRAGLSVVELDGWQTRARSSGGYDGAPWCVMWHHTASGGNGRSDAEYGTYRADARPIANLFIGRDAIVYVCAAGATNTNGSGGPLTLPDGRTVAASAMNTRAVGIEISNNGVGMPYPQAQIDAAFAASIAITEAYIDAKADNVAQHVDWAPGRKIDPATAVGVEGPWRPATINSSGSWRLADLRAECLRRASTTTPARGDGDMNIPATIWTWDERVDTFVRGDDGQCWHQWWPADPTKPGEGQPWSHWESLGGQLAGSPWAAYKQDRIDLWARGTDDTIWQNTYLGASHGGDGTWSGWFATAGWPGR